MPNPGADPASEVTTPAMQRRRLPPPATTLASSSSSPNPAATASSPYFLPELISQIASRLTTLHDFFALRATYRDLLPPSPSSLASQAPHLLLVPGSRALFHLPLRRHLRFRLPLPDTDPSITTPATFYSFGCLVAIASPSHHDLSFIHLLTGERFRLPHPPADFCRLLLSGDLVLAFVPTVGRAVQYCRLGDTEWRVVSCREPYVIEDLIFLKGTLHALVRSAGICYRLAAVDLSDTNSVEFTFLGDQLDTQAAHACLYFCLAECLDELLLVGATGDTPEEFHVFRWQSVEGKWTRTTSLGGCTLFLSYFCFANRMRCFGGFFFASCLGPDHPGVRRDYLYLTDAKRKWVEYSLADGSCDEYVAENFEGAAWSHSDCRAPVWVFPSMC